MTVNKFQLLVSVSICVIILAVAVAIVRTARADTRDAIRVSEVRQIQAALEMFFAEKNSYPVAGAGVILGRAGAVCLSTEGFSDNCGSERRYLPSVPGALGSSPYIYLSQTASGEDCAEFPCASYALQFRQEKKRELLGKGANCARPDTITIGGCRSK